MLLYTYKCPECGKIEDAYRSIDDRNNGPDCHGIMNKIITPTMLQPILGAGDDPGYLCPVTEKWVDSKRKRREIMAEHNLVENG